MKKMGEKANKVCNIYFYAVTVASLLLSVLFLAEWTLVLFEVPLNWVPTWYQVFYRASLWINPCLLVAFIAPFLALVCVRKIKFRDYKVQFVLFVIGAILCVLNLVYALLIISRIFGAS